MTSNEVAQKLELMTAQGYALAVVCFIRFQFRYGLRISDLRRITPASIKANNTIIVYQGKGSQPLICPIVDDLEFWLQFKQGLHSDMSCYSVSFFYKLYTKFSLVIYNGYGKRKSVTHSARKLLAQTLYSETQDINVAASALGHNNTSSTVYYLEKQQRSGLTNTGVQKVNTGVNNSLYFYKRNGKMFVKAKK